jgi:hypothetical protein
MMKTPAQILDTLIAYVDMPLLKPIDAISLVAKIPEDQRQQLVEALEMLSGGASKLKAIRASLND